MEQSETQQHEVESALNVAIEHLERDLDIMLDYLEGGYETKYDNWIKSVLKRMGLLMFVFEEGFT